MNYVGRLSSYVKGLYQGINPSTLTGAIDVLVIEQPDGSLVCSPFHVKFGKLGVLKAREKIVDIEINGCPVDIHMKLGDAGEAFFVHEVNSPDLLTDSLSTSPINSVDDLMRDGLAEMQRVTFQPITETNNAGGGEKCETEAGDYKDDQMTRIEMPVPLPATKSDSELELSTDISIERKKLPLKTFRSHSLSYSSSLPTFILEKGILTKAFSDDEFATDDNLPGSSSRPSSPLSDSEVTSSPTQAEEESWKWGELPSAVKPKDVLPMVDEGTPSKEETNASSGGFFGFMRSAASPPVPIEGVYLDEVGKVEPEVAALYLPPRSPTSNGFVPPRSPTEDGESGMGRSLPHSPVIADAEADDEASEGPKDISMSLCGGLRDGIVSEDRFQQHAVKLEDFSKNPDLLTDPDLVVKIDGAYYCWSVAAPVLMSHLVFNAQLPTEVLNSLKMKYMPKKERRRGMASWFSWRRGNSADDVEANQRVDASAVAVESDSDSARNKDVDNIRSADEADVESDDEGKPDRRKRLVRQKSDKFRKSLRLESKQLHALRLQYGANEAQFSVTTRYQGTTRCNCTVYLWHYDDRIVISDIDGTITRSDVLGQVFPLLGKDWSHSGVTRLFNTIATNGYQVIYLSARAIGQAGYTKDFLRSVVQQEEALPDGPLFVSPSSLMHAFTKEVIEKKPEEFKIKCLRDIAELFPSKSPFYAGFGNKVNDVFAYRAVGVPMSHIFTINHLGEVTHELTHTFQSTYTELSDMADHMFPPTVVHEYHPTFSAFLFWREPAVDIELGEET